MKPLTQPPREGAIGKRESGCHPRAVERQRVIVVAHERNFGSELRHVSPPHDIGARVIVCEARRANEVLLSGSWHAAIVDVTQNGPLLLGIVGSLEPALRRAVIVLANPTNHEEINRATLMDARVLVRPIPDSILELLLRKCLGLKSGPAMRAVVESLAQEFSFDRIDREIAALTLSGVRGRLALARARGVTEEAIKKNVRSLITKCGVADLEGFVRLVLSRVEPCL